MDSTVHGILWVRILERVAVPFSRGIFPTQGSNPGLPHCRWILYQLSPPGKPKNIGVGSLSLLQGIFLTQGSNWVSCIAGGFFTNWAIREALAFRAHPPSWVKGWCPVTAHVTLREEGPLKVYSCLCAAKIRTLIGKEGHLSGSGCSWDPPPPTPAST